MNKLLLLIVLIASVYASEGPIPTGRPRTVRPCRRCQCPLIPRWAQGIRFPSAAQAKAYAMRQCRFKNKFIRYSCVYDRSVGIEHNKGVYAALAAFHYKGQTCTSAGDPHVKTFSGRRYNVYNVHNRWRTLLSSKNLYARTFLTYSRRWGRRSLNRQLFLRLGRRTYRFKTRGNANVKWTRNHRHFKQVVLRKYGYSVNVVWRTSPQGGYYSVTIAANKYRIGNCKAGDCCAYKNYRRRKYRGKGKLRRFRGLRSIKFKSRCARKIISYRKCRAYVKKERKGKQYRRWRYITLRRCVRRRSRCVVRRRKPKRKRCGWKCRGKNWLAGYRFLPSYKAKALAVRACRHRNKFIEYSCVYDRSIGIFHNRHEYNRLASYHFAGKRCITAGDPHMLSFGNRRFNVYHVHNQWRTLLSSNGLYAKTFLTFSRRWGRRSLNRRVYLRVRGKTYSFGPNGKSNTRWNRSNRNNKSKTIKRGGYRVIVSWNRSPQGGYYNVNIWAAGSLLRKCNGLCCSGYRKYNGRAKLKRHFRTIRSIRWRSVCTRKRVALRKCRATYYAARYRRVNNNRKWQLIRHCIMRKRNL